MNIVLLEPEIPFNTGAIGRTCVATDTALHLIRPYGFVLSDRNLKRAGLDYWDKLELYEYNSYESFMESRTGPGSPKLWYATTKAHRLYTEADFGPGDYIMFGKESAGIPEEILVDNEETCIRIPMGGGIRSLNLANSVAIVLYEALRQNGFPGLVPDGELHRLHWKEKS